MVGPSAGELAPSLCLGNWLFSSMPHKMLDRRYICISLCSCSASPPISPPSAQRPATATLRRPFFRSARPFLFFGYSCPSALSSASHGTTLASLSHVPLRVQDKGPCIRPTPANFLCLAANRHCVTNNPVVPGPLSTATTLLHCSQKRPFL